jgi:putative spermidine/putrescine transport system substrate-binding protein
MADGVAAADLYPLDLDRALGQLDLIYGSIGDHWWVDGAEPVAWLGTERVDLSSAWHYRLIAGQRDGLAVDLVWDDGLLVVDHWVIPAGAASADVAADFLRYAGGIGAHRPSEPATPASP